MNKKSEHEYVCNLRASNEDVWDYAGERESLRLAGEHENVCDYK
jgi:hypothetical protein